ASAAAESAPAAADTSPEPVLAQVTGALSEPEPESDPEPVTESATEPIPERSRPKPAKPEAPQRRQRKRSRAEGDDQEGDRDTQLTLEAAAISATDGADVSAGFGVEADTITEILAEDIVSPAQSFEDDLDEEDDLDDDLDGDDLDDDLDGDDDDDDDDFGAGDDLAGLGEFHIQTGAFLQVLPLSEATIPRTFYLVVDRAAELITRPLKDFAELGQIPDEETLAKTLPIFDNHRVAKRFVRRSQRVVKVPDGKMLTKVSPYLQAKGITRLLIDGQVYSVGVE
ncbi:MAG TPA: transposase, partial [Chroococcidiopsis sp.]